MRIFMKSIRALLITLFLVQKIRSEMCNCGIINGSSFKLYNLVENGCPVQPDDNVYLSSRATNATGIFTQRFMICCCSAQKTYDSSTEIESWTFKGELLDHSKWKITKDNRGIYSYYLDKVDIGDYDCKFRRRNTTDTQSVYLNILKSDPYCGEPKNYQVSPITVAVLPGGKNIKYQCSAYIGEDWSGAKHSLQFFKGTQNSEMRPDENIRINITINSDGIIGGNLTIREVTKKDYGDYCCVITNFNHRVLLNFSLVNDVSEHDRKVGHLRTLVTVLCAITALVTILFCFWLRCRISMVLLCKEQERPMRHYDEFLFDLFIVHGIDSETWVLLQLLPVIERGAKYQCFVPSRDMLAGKSIADQLPRIMQKCRKVLIVLSSLLFDSDWAVLASYSAVSESLLNGGRSTLTLIILEKINNAAYHFSKHDKLLKLLSEYPSIEVPPQTRLSQLTSNEIQQIIQSIFINILLIRNPHLGIKDQESSYEVDYDENKDNCSHMMSRHSSLKVGPVPFTLSKLFWFKVHAVIGRDVTHQFWSDIFRALPPSPLRLSTENALLNV